MEAIELKTRVRQGRGKNASRVLRREGKLPAVLYGPDTEPLLLSVDTHELELAVKSGPSGQLLLRLVIENGERTTRRAMIKELQRHPLSREPLHVDFYEISMDRKISVKVPVVTTGESKGVAMGGMLQIIRHELEVECLPDRIPEKIEIDITELDVGDSVHVQEIPLAEGVEFPADVNFTVLTILSPKKEEEDVTGEEEEGEELEMEAEGGQETESAESAE